MLSESWYFPCFQSHLEDCLGKPELSSPPPWLRDKLFLPGHSPTSSIVSPATMDMGKDASPDTRSSQLQVPAPERTRLRLESTSESVESSCGSTSQATTTQANTGNAIRHGRRLASLDSQGSTSDTLSSALKGQLELITRSAHASGDGASNKLKSAIAKIETEFPADGRSPRVHHTPKVLPTEKSAFVPTAAFASRQDVQTNVTLKPSEGNCANTSRESMANTSLILEGKDGIPSVRARREDILNALTALTNKMQKMNNLNSFSSQSCGGEGFVVSPGNDLLKLSDPFHDAFRDGESREDKLQNALFGDSDSDSSPGYIRPISKEFSGASTVSLNELLERGLENMETPREESISFDDFRYGCDSDEESTKEMKKPFRIGVQTEVKGHIEVNILANGEFTQDGASKGEKALLSGVSQAEEAELPPTGGEVKSSSAQTSPGMDEVLTCECRGDPDISDFQVPVMAEGAEALVEEVQLNTQCSVIVHKPPIPRSSVSRPNTLDLGPCSHGNSSSPGRTPSPKNDVFLPAGMHSGSASPCSVGSRGRPELRGCMDYSSSSSSETSAGTGSEYSSDVDETTSSDDTPSIPEPPPVVEPKPPPPKIAMKPASHCMALPSETWKPKHQRLPKQNKPREKRKTRRKRSSSRDDDDRKKSRPKKKRDASPKISTSSSRKSLENAAVTNAISQPKPNGVKKSQEGRKCTSTSSASSDKPLKLKQPLTPGPQREPGDYVILEIPSPKSEPVQVADDLNVHGKKLPVMSTPPIASRKIRSRTPSAEREKSSTKTSKDVKISLRSQVTSSPDSAMQQSFSSTSSGSELIKDDGYSSNSVMSYSANVPHDGSRTAGLGHPPTPTSLASRSPGKSSNRGEAASSVGKLVRPEPKHQSKSSSKPHLRTNMNMDDIKNKFSQSGSENLQEMGIQYGSQQPYQRKLSAGEVGSVLPERTQAQQRNDYGDYVELDPHWSLNSVENSRSSPEKTPVSCDTTPIMPPQDPIYVNDSYAKETKRNRPRIPKSSSEPNIHQLTSKPFPSSRSDCAIHIHQNGCRLRPKGSAPSIRRTSSDSRLNECQFQNVSLAKLVIEKLKADQSAVVGSAMATEMAATVPQNAKVQDKKKHSSTGQLHKIHRKWPAPSHKEKNQCIVGYVQAEPTYPRMPLMSGKGFSIGGTDTIFEEKLQKAENGTRLCAEGSENGYTSSENVVCTSRIDFQIKFITSSDMLSFGRGVCQRTVKVSHVTNVSWKNIYNVPV